MGEPSMGRAESYRGPSGAIVGESPWFCYADIPGSEDLVVVIEDVQQRTGVKFASGRANAVEMSLKFVGYEKPLRVNVTIRRVLDQLFTTDTGAWVGKPIALYVQTGIRVGNDERSGVRVRNKTVPMPSPRAAAPKAAPAQREPGEDDSFDAPKVPRERLIADLIAAARTGPEVKNAAAKLGLRADSPSAIKALTDQNLLDMTAAVWPPIS